MDPINVPQNISNVQFRNGLRALDRPLGGSKSFERNKKKIYCIFLVTTWLLSIYTHTYLLLYGHLKTRSFFVIWNIMIISLIYFFFNYFRVQCRPLFNCQEANWLKMSVFLHILLVCMYVCVSIIASIYLNRWYTFEKKIVFFIEFLLKENFEIFLFYY